MPNFCDILALLNITFQQGLVYELIR
jgi:hypothetical protein